MSDAIKIRLIDGILDVTLDRADKRNALSDAMISGLAEAMARAELDSDVRLVAIRGAGADFCAGADLGELLASVDRTLEENERDALHLGEVFLAIRRLPKLVVAVVQGRALAGGAGLATAADLVLASRDASFGYPEIERGFVPAMVMTMLRRAVGEKRGMELVATGRVVSADEALAMGLISRVFDPETFAADATNLLQLLASRSASAIGLSKQLFTELDDRTFSDGILLGARVNAIARSTPDFRTSIEGFLRK